MKEGSKLRLEREASKPQNGRPKLQIERSTPASKHVSKLQKEGEIA
jgi:hypothetical protein